MNRSKIAFCVFLILAGSILTVSARLTPGVQWALMIPGGLMQGSSWAKLWVEVDGDLKRIYLPFVAMTIWWAILVKLFH